MSELVQGTFYLYQHTGVERTDLAPPDLLSAGWVLLPHFNTDLFVARKYDGIGGSVYSAPDTLEQVIKYVRQVYIAKIPWTG